MAGYGFRLRSSSFARRASEDRSSYGGQVASNPPYTLSQKLRCLIPGVQSTTIATVALLFEGVCVQAPFIGQMLRRLWVGRATIVCPVMSRTTNAHVNERDLSMKYLTIAAVAAAVLAWSQLAYAQGWQHCATEGGFCRAPAGAVVHYGREGAFAHRRSPPGGLPCSNDVFGDPIPGVHKECFLSY
jgi:hypothetical protein